MIKIDPNFQTPPPVCKYMANMVPDEAITVLEPTPGLGNIVKELSYYEITAPDDFFLLEKKRFDCVVMNPPFSAKSAVMDNCPIDAETKGMKLGYYILTQCMEMSDNVIALMPWYTIADSDVRLKHLQQFGIKSITTLPRKTFQYARVQCVVIQLQKGFKGDSLFKTFNF